MPKNLPKAKHISDLQPNANEKKRPEEESSQAERFERLYANHAQVQSSFYDFRLHFNQVISATPGKLVLEEQCTVSMSPEHAADLLRALQTAVAGYEVKFGPIRRGPSPGE